jgi:hypothetical protein
VNNLIFEPRQISLQGRFLEDLRLLIGIDLSLCD